MTHAYVLHARAFDAVLQGTAAPEWPKLTHVYNSLYPPDYIRFEERAIDVFYCAGMHWPRRRSYAVYPLVALQRAETSVIHGTEVDYRARMRALSDAAARL